MLTSSGGIDDERLIFSPELERAQVIRASTEAGGEGEETLYTVDCETEILHVISGRFLLCTAGGDVELHDGDSLSFSGSEPHSWRNLGEGAAEIIWVLVTR